VAVAGVTVEVKAGVEALEVEVVVAGAMEPVVAGAAEVAEVAEVAEEAAEAAAAVPVGAPLQERRDRPSDSPRRSPLPAAFGTP
jgi:hypothetical protein